MNKEYYMEIAEKYLSYAKDELSLALNYLSDFINIDNTVFKEGDINNLKNRINNQMYSINHYIIPAIRSEE